MVFVCWITKATDTHSEYEILIVFCGNIGYARAPRYYVHTVIVFLVRNSSLDIQQTEESIYIKC